MTTRLPSLDSHSSSGKKSGEIKQKKKKNQNFDRGSKNRVSPNYQKLGVREIYSRNSKFLVVWFLSGKRGPSDPARAACDCSERAEHVAAVASPLAQLYTPTTENMELREYISLTPSFW